MRKPASISSGQGTFRLHKEDSAVRDKPFADQHPQDPRVGICSPMSATTL